MISTPSRWGVRAAGSLLMGVLAAAVILALKGNGDEPTADPIPSRDDLTPLIGSVEDRSAVAEPEPEGANPLAEPAPGTPPAHLLADSDPARRHLLRRAIGDSGYACDEILSAAALDGSGGTWRVNCGQALLYWVGLDEFGRWTIEPGNYTEPLTGPTIERTLTIQPDEIDSLIIR